MKGAEILVRAFADLGDDYPAMRLLVAGDGIQRQELERLASDLGLADRVIFLGYVPNEKLPAFYNACTVFVNPTLAVESFGITVAEAMACGRTVVASRRGGICTSVDHEKTGLLVPAGDVAALAKALRSLLSDPVKRERFGAASREKAQRELSEKRMVDDFLAVSQQLAK
jgi:glycosyltransferase involved in cell wall biosynthesis